MSPLGVMPLVNSSLAHYTLNDSASPTGDGTDFTSDFLRGWGTYSGLIFLISFTFAMAMFLFGWACARTAYSEANASLVHSADCLIGLATELEEQAQELNANREQLNASSVSNDMDAEDDDGDDEAQQLLQVDCTCPESEKIPECVGGGHDATNVIDEHTLMCLLLARFARFKARELQKENDARILRLLVESGFLAEESV
ncbi:hypothetical protein VKT23_011737 [Stygiomarasmius scandens]|uniref:Uncharacterized protein n=1 Tax=Marasmiellus scandens TaxID=2682957 RepID=A0ABR1J7X2_9AGAR